jgi:predicted ATPase with chaperone activity
MIYNYVKMRTAVRKTDFPTKSTIFWNMTPCSLVMSTDVLEECNISTFRVKDYAKQLSRSKQRHALFLLNAGESLSGYKTPHP